MALHTQKSNGFASALQSQEPAIFVDGIGALDQYGSYIDSFYSKGIIYYVRDYYWQRLQVTPPHQAGPLQAKLDGLNSDILVWEHASRDVVGRASRE